MSSAVITALLLGTIMLIAANVIISVLRERRRHKLAAQQSTISTHPLDAHVTMILHMQEGVVVGVEKPPPLPTFTFSS